MKIVAIVLSYNVPEVTDRLVENLRSLCRDLDIVVYDNGSDEDKLSKYTTHRSLRNSRMTRGFNSALFVAGHDYPDHAKWLFTSDCYFITQANPVANSLKWLEKYPDIGILHPSEDACVHCCWDVHNQGQGLKLGWMYDFVCPLFTPAAMDVLQWRFDHDLYHGWGLDFESSYLVRQAGMKVAINHDLIVMHETSTTYDRGRDSQYANRKAFYDAALQEMRGVFTKKYGPDWEARFQREFTDGVGTWRT